MMETLLANKNKIAAILIVIILGFFWYSYKSTSNNSGTLPIIYAPTSAYKIQPDDPGGYQIQNDDVTIYNALRGEEDWEGFDPSSIEQEKSAELDFTEEETNDQETDVVGSPNVVDDEAAIDEPEVENLFDIVSASDSNDDYLSRIKKGVDAIEPAKEKAEETAPSAGPSSSDVKETQQNIESVVDKIAQAPVKKPVAEATITKQAPKETAPTDDLNETIIDSDDPKLTHFVQLGSFRTETAALTGLQSFQSKYSPLLKAKPTTFEKVSIPEKGDFIRVKAGPFEKSDADSLCNQIKDKKGSCYVTAK